MQSEAASAAVGVLRQNAGGGCRLAGVKAGGYFEGEVEELLQEIRARIEAVGVEDGVVERRAGE